MVGIAKRFLLLMFFMYSIWHYAQESFKLGCEIIGFRKEMPMGNNNVIDNNKTLTTMEKTTNFNEANLEAQIQEPSKNPATFLFKI